MTTRKHGSSGLRTDTSKPHGHTAARSVQPARAERTTDASGASTPHPAGAGPATAPDSRRHLVGTVSHGRRFYDRSPKVSHSASFSRPAEHLEWPLGHLCVMTALFYSVLVEKISKQPLFSQTAASTSRAPTANSSSAIDSPQPLSVLSTAPVEGPSSASCGISRSILRRSYPATPSRTTFRTQPRSSVASGS